MGDNIIACGEQEESITATYPQFLESLRSHFCSVTSNSAPLFTTDAEGLYDAFLQHLPERARTLYTCHACMHFVERYGGLVAIQSSGETEPAIWNDDAAPAFFKASVHAMQTIVAKAKVTGVFLSEKETLGQPVTGDWQHMSISLPTDMIYRPVLKTAYQMEAQKLEDFKTLISGLLEYPSETVEQAVTLLKTESLYRSEKCLGVAEWLRDLHRQRAAAKNSRVRENLVWLAVATAPAGYCHIKSTMIGTLLDDLVAGMPFDAVSRRFAEKMHPLQYMRPQAAPTAGNIAQAEKIAEKLGIQKSLVRRYARLEELEKIWVPKEKEGTAKASGLFSHLLPKDKKAKPMLEIPPGAITWRKFSETVLPFAESIEFFVRSGKDNFAAIVTAKYDDAPPIHQWDSVEKRNPFSHYVYHGGSSCDGWGLSAGYCKVAGICYQPSMWYGDYPHQSKGVVFILEGARDSRYKTCGNALFPETLKSELHEIRSTIEAYSKSAVIDGYDVSSACGIDLQYGQNWSTKFRVTTNTGTAIYNIDRWD